jgi:hypothetical protein
MALPAFSDFLPDESTPFAGGKASMPHFFPKPVKKITVSVYEPRFQHGGLGSDVRIGHVNHISPCAHAVPKSITHIPQQIERFPYYSVWWGFLAEKHQIDVRVGIQLTPTIAPERQERTGGVVRGMVCQDILKNGTYHIINEGSKMADNIPATGTGIVFLAEPLLRSDDESLEAL